MPTIHEQDGFRWMIYFDDHIPSHVHVYKAGTEVVINLGDADTRPVVRENKGMSRQNIRRALRMADEQQNFLLEEWRRIING